MKNNLFRTSSLKLFLCSLCIFQNSYSCAEKNARSAQTPDGARGSFMQIQGQSLRQQQGKIPDTPIFKPQSGVHSQYLGMEHETKKHIILRVQQINDHFLDLEVAEARNNQQFCVICMHDNVKAQNSLIRQKCNHLIHMQCQRALQYAGGLHCPGCQVVIKPQNSNKCINNKTSNGKTLVIASILVYLCYCIKKNLKDKKDPNENPDKIKPKEPIQKKYIINASPAY